MPMALAIAVFHIWWYEPAPYPALESAHWIFDEAFLKIRAGVQVLLVISGFVIAYTLRNTWVTPVEILSFAARRLVRLVPTYWVTIAFVILVDAACRNFLGLASPVDGHLSPLRISAHLAFLQDIFGHDALSAGMWTICIEMQFYLVAIIGWGVAQHAFRRPVMNEPRPSTLAILIVFVPVALMSLFYWRTLDSTSPWVIHFAWMFFMGMITWWTLDRTVPVPAYAVIVSIALLDLIFDAKCRHEILTSLTNTSWGTPMEIEIESWRYENSVVLATALAIFLAGRRQSLHSWLNWRWLQYLGRISYSLYLIHFSVCHIVTTAGWKYFGNSPTSVQAAIILFFSLIASLLAAHILYVFVEAPSVSWAAKMKRAS